MDEMEPWDRSAAQRIADAYENKRLGTEKFKAQDYKCAGNFYINALRDVIPIIPLDEEHLSDVNNLKQSCYANLAACQLKLKQYDRVIRSCTKVLEIDSGNVKTLYRRATAYIECNNLDDGKCDVEKMLSLEPGNTVAMEMTRKLESLYKKKNQSDAQMMKAFMNSP